MNLVSVVVLASPPRNLIRSKSHNGRRLRELHTYNAGTPPPPWSSKVRWSGRWDQQHDSVVIMVESICEQGFAYAREVEEDRQRSSQTRARKYYKRQTWSRLKQFLVLGQPLNLRQILSFIGVSDELVLGVGAKPSIDQIDLSGDTSSRSISINLRPSPWGPIAAPGACGRSQARASTRALLASAVG
jgi:hypothetical protein